MDWLNSIVSVANDYLWSYVLIAMLVGVGLMFTVRTKFVQIVQIPEMIRLLFEGVGAKAREGHITTFQAFCISTASRVGVGNIAGIALAVTLGGPGAIFWMWVIATIGAASGFVESTLAQIYKVRGTAGNYVGGPAYYIKNVLKSKFFAALFAVLITITYGVIFNSVQANTMALSLEGAFGFSTTTTGIVTAALTAFILVGGMRRIAKVVEVMVPIMAGLYLGLALIVMLMNITSIPAVISQIVSCAFGFDSVMGAGIGAAMMNGIKRGLFSNEAGMGSIPNAAAAADATHPVKQGLVQGFGVYVNTMFVCTASAMLVLIVPGWEGLGKTGIALIQHNLTHELGSWASILLTVTVLFFAFSSVIGNYFYGEINMYFITKNRLALPFFRLCVVAMVYVGSVASLSFVWNMADLFMALMTIVNLVAIALLGKYAYAALDDYIAQKKRGVLEPEFDPSVLPDQTGVECWPRRVTEEIKQ